jgi:hypothetical protein
MLHKIVPQGIATALLQFKKARFALSNQEKWYNPQHERTRDDVTTLMFSILDSETLS